MGRKDNVSATLRKRSKRSWTVVLSWYEFDSEGNKKRVQRSEAVPGNQVCARRRRDEILAQLSRGEYSDPSDMTVGQWLDFWLENRIKTQCRLRTYEGYESIGRVHLKPSFGSIPLQAFDSLHLEEYYREKSNQLSQTTLEQHHAVISGALKWALKKGLIVKNPAPLVDNRPSAPQGRNEAKDHCWTAQEAQAFLLAARSFGPQSAAFYTLALESGMRKGELCGLQWSNVDLALGKVLVDRQLVKISRPPIFGPLKRGRARTISISSEMVELLSGHRKNQSELKMKNRDKYCDLGLVFAKEWSELGGARSQLGDPLQANNLGQREFADIIKQAGVRSIKFHGMRHTTATLLLRSGVPVHVVSERLGHKGIEITLNIYAHVLPDQQEDAAKRLGSLLHG